MLLFILSLLGCKYAPSKGELLSTVERENPNFSVRINCFREKRTFAQALAGANYIFEVKTKNEINSREIMFVELDDVIPIDSKSIGFVNGNIGYVFMKRKYAVTTDGGMNWKIWDGIQFPLMKNDLSCGIQNVNVEENGSGVMSLNCSDRRKELITKDFGISWNQ